MLRALLLPLLFVAHLFHATVDSDTTIAARAASSIVRVTGTVQIIDFFQGPLQGTYVCSGEVIAPNRVLTAAHCVGDAMLADGVPVLHVLGTDKFYDLALLDVPTAKPALVLRDGDAVVNEPLLAMGYAWGYNVITTLQVHPILVNIIPYKGGAPGILVQGAYIGGMSGGPVIDRYGEMVGIVQQRTEDGAGYGVGSVVIRAFLLGIL